MVSICWEIVLLLTISFTAVSCDNIESKQVVKRNIPVDFHNGDIIFRRGSGVASHAVIGANPRGSFSHVGIVLNVDGEWRAVHVVPYEGKSIADDKIYSEPIGQFFNTIKASSGAVYRLPSLDSLDRNIIRGYVERQLLKEVAFDHDYDLSDSGKLYCSELVWRSYIQVGVDITNGSRTKVAMPLFSGVHIMPADIEQNRDIELLYRF